MSKYGTNITMIQSDKPSKMNKTGVKGVYLDKEKGSYRASITFQNERYFLGRYSTIRAAAKVRKEAEKQVYGPFLEWYAELQKNQAFFEEENQMAEAISSHDQSKLESKKPRQIHDAINHPAHYIGKVECIDSIEVATDGLEGIEAVCTGNVIKYIWRWKKKNGVEDLRKARWYLEKLIEKIEVQND